MEEKVGVLERAASLAKESLTKIEAPAKEKAAEESKVASEAKAKADAKQKEDEGKKLAEAEAKAKEDERILTVEDKDLSEPEIKRKAELKEIKRKKDESPDEKIKRVQEASQKRIDEIKSELLAKTNKDAEEMAALRAELEELKKPKQQEDAAAKSKREESERIAKYVEEDKGKTRENRREMSKDDLDEWYLEDPTACTEWMQERAFRRSDERKAAEERIKNEEANKTSKQLSEEFISKQTESRNKLSARFPGVIPSKERLAELKGKPRSEQVEILCAENEEFKLCTDIVAEDPKKYLESVNGPELVMAEMEKRLKKPADDKGGKKVITLSEEELEAKIQAEADRRASLDEGITSTKGKIVDNKDNKNKSALRQHQERIAKKANIKIEDLDKTIARRQGIPGAGSFNIDGVDEG